MWTLEENPNCARTRATFSLVGDDLVPAAIEQSTGLVADFSAAKGEPGRVRDQATGVWLISSEGSVDSTSAEKHILYLLERVEAVAGQLLEVMDEQSLEARFGCYWVSAAGQGGPGVSAETLLRIGSLNAMLTFEFHGPFDDD
jgi:hypothetical protein